MKIEKKFYGQTKDGRPIDLYTLANVNGMTAELTNFGAILAGLTVPDRQGRFDDVTLGYDNLDGWMGDKACLGATVGRYGNRIAKGRFTLDGKTFQLAVNDGDNHLHGGIKGFHKAVWDGEAAEVKEGASVEFRYTSYDGEEGYPGALTARVTYTLTNDNELKIVFHATTDKPTIVNLVHHSYWNLTGDPRSNILDHELMLNSDRYLPVAPDAIPTGDPVPVTGTPMDFTRPTAIGKRIVQVKGGYDHNWALRGAPGRMELAARVHEPSSGRVMEILTDQPGIQFYAGNYLDGSIVGRHGIVYHRRCGFCLETQCWPDSPNRPGFPCPVLRPGETYTHVMAHRFGVR